MKRLSKQKTVWRSIGIPKALFKQVLKLIHYTGDPSVAEYVRIAVRQRINRDEARLETDE